MVKRLGLQKGWGAVTQVAFEEWVKSVFQTERRKAWWDGFLGKFQERLSHPVWLKRLREDQGYVQANEKETDLVPRVV